MNNPKISVIMPVLAPDPGFFALAVGSILNQNDANLELIIVEDPSDIEASSVLANFDDDRIVHVRNRVRSGLVRQLNQGAGMARGEYLARMDADDIAEPNRLAEQTRFLDFHHEVGVLGCQKTVIGPNGEVIGLRDYPLAHTEIVRTLRWYCPIAHPGVMMRASAFRAVGGYSDSPAWDGAEDYELWWRMVDAGIQFANHPERLLRYRIQPQQSKTTRLRHQLRATIAIKRSRFDRSFGMLGIMRLGAEISLLRLSPRWVLRLFQILVYRRPTDRIPRRPASSPIDVGCPQAGQTASTRRISNESSSHATRRGSI